MCRIVVVGFQLAEEYFGSFWKYSTRQVEFWGEQTSNAQKTMPRQNRSTVFFAGTRVSQQPLSGRACGLNSSLKLGED